MIDELGGPTEQLVRMALDAAVMRHQAIATNIANANTPGYRAMRVNFEEQLARSRSILATDDRQEDLKRVRAFLEPDAATRSSDTKTMLDVEMVKLAQNTVQYQALIKGIGKLMSPIALAINEGRR